MPNVTTNKANHTSGNVGDRQWGSEKDLSPLSILHDTPTDFVILFSRIAIVLAVIFWLMYVTSVIVRLLIDVPQNYHFTVELFEYALIVSFLTLSALIYLITRQGAFQRFKKHARTPQRVLEEYFSFNKSSITVLVPSYREEVRVVRKTLLSAALQEFPDVRVVLLLDDKPLAVCSEDMDRMERTRMLVNDIETLLCEPRQHSLDTLKQIKNSRSVNDSISAVAQLYGWAARWLDDMADKEPSEDHVDVFFADHVLRNLSCDLRAVAEELFISARREEDMSPDRLEQLCNRLLWIFNAKLEIFERKKYVSLSHEPNKAMNLNSYIGLMGGKYRKEKTSDGVMLMAERNSHKADLIIDDSEFVLTLDADSILLPGYCSRLVYFLKQPDNAGVAVVQTPYSSFRGAPSRLERLASATTDIQHILHQGMSYYNATFWVGANAIIRKSALEDVVEKEWIGGFEIKRYIQDYTVIEDTESSIDMTLRGWRLVNYPERLSYSATPSDFGSLVIQRQRWANGGLLIFPKLLKLARERKNQGKPLSKTELLLRTNYMLSIAWSNIGLIFLLVYPYDGRLLSSLVILAALPYFIAMAMDLKYCRYKYSDIFRIYGFNLILLPVNVAGTFKSLKQALTTKKIPFARTPKIKNRTATAWPYLIAPIFIAAFSLFTFWRNIEGENWGNAAFAGFNAFATTWAIIAYIGIKNLVTDLWFAFTDWLYVEVDPDTAPYYSVRALQK